MRLSSKLFLSSLMVAIPTGCNSGGGVSAVGGGNQPTLRAADLAGTWQVAMTRTECSCAGPVIGESEVVDVAITVDGAKVTIRQAGQPDAVLDLVGNRCRGTNVDTSGGLRETSTIDFGIVNGKIEGSEKVVDVDVATNQQNCEQTYTMIGDKRPGAPTPSADRFNGTWDLRGIVTSVEGQGCDPANVVGNVDNSDVTIVVTGTNATLTPVGQAAVLFTVQNGRLLSTETETAGPLTITKTIDLGIVSDNSFEGTVTVTTRDDNTVVCTVISALTAVRL